MKVSLAPGARDSIAALSIAAKSVYDSLQADLSREDSLAIAEAVPFKDVLPDSAAQLGMSDAGYYIVAKKYRHKSESWVLTVVFRLSGDGLAVVLVHVWPHLPSGMERVADKP